MYVHVHKSMPYNTCVQTRSVHSSKQRSHLRGQARQPDKESTDASLPALGPASAKRPFRIQVAMSSKAEPGAAVWLHAISRFLLRRGATNMRTPSDAKKIPVRTSCLSICVQVIIDAKDKPLRRLLQTVVAVRDTRLPKGSSQSIHVIYDARFAVSQSNYLTASSLLLASG